MMHVSLNVLNEYTLSKKKLLRINQAPNRSRACGKTILGRSNFTAYCKKKT